MKCAEFVSRMRAQL